MSVALPGRVTKLFLYLGLLGGGLFVVGALRNQSFDHWSIFWNLLLAWIPYLASIWLVRLLKTHRWQSFWPLMTTVIWLIFLPNTFYMITDFIHLHDVPRVDEVFDVVMFGAIIMNGVLLGFASVMLVHSELARRLSPRRAWRYVLGILLAASFAIYVGRYLRWNSWDVLTNPAGLLFDVSERIIHPLAYPQTFITTATFFVVLSVGYALLRQTVVILRK